MSKVYIALGTNIEPRKDHILKSIQLLQEHSEVEVIKQSSIYETKPVGYTDQADFLNMVVLLNTSLNPMSLLKYCQDIEKKLGRIRTFRFGPRSIDLDLLLFDNKTIETEELTIPHPRMTERAFVLVPLKEIASGITIGSHSVETWLEQLDQTDLDGISVLNQRELKK